MFKKFVIFLTVFLTFYCSKPCLAHQPVIVGDQTIQVQDPEISRAFYDELSGSPERYFVNSSKKFDLYINLLVPLKANTNGRYSAKVYDLNNNLNLITTLEGTSIPWSLYYETFAKDYYYKGPEFDQILPAGKYAIDVYSGDNQGKYVLALGKTEDFSVKNSFNIISILRDLKVNFFNTSPFVLALTIFGIIYFISIFIIAVFFTLICNFIIYKVQKTKPISSKISLKRKLIKSGISIILIILGLYTWNLIILFIADVLIFDTITEFFK